MIKKLTDEQIRDWGHVCGLAGTMGAILGIMEEVAGNDIAELERCAKQFFELKRVRWLVRLLKAIQVANEELKKLGGGNV